MEQEELKTILRKHKLWLNDEEGGECADLSNKDLRDVDLVGHDLRKANLSNADLSNADLFDTNLCGANLRNANLSNTDLVRADLRDSDLSNADLSNADLWEANLRGANLSRAKLYAADLQTAVMSDVLRRDKIKETIIMKDNDNNVNVGDVFKLKAKVLSRGGYCPASGYLYRLQLLTDSGENLAQVTIYISNPEDLLDKEKPVKCSAFRPLQVGDIAKCVEVRGRKPNCSIGDVNVLLKGDIVTVVTNEADTKNGTVGIKFQCGTKAIIDPVYLELLTPVEELKPYYVEPGKYNRFIIKKGNLEYSYFPFGEHCVLSMYEAKAAAEAECDRLNEEWRKHSNK